MVASMMPASLGASAVAIYFAPAVFALDKANVYSAYAFLVLMAVGCSAIVAHAIWDHFHYVPIYKRVQKEEWKQKKLEVKMGLRYPVTRFGRAWAHVHYVPMYKRQRKWEAAQARKNKA